MKHIKKVSVLLILILILILAGCGGSQVSGGATKTVTDCAGRTVEIPENPQRIACMYASTAHMMAMLDQGDKLVGCPKGVKSDVLMQMKYPEIEETATPYQEGSINVEELLRIEADLVIIRQSTAEHQGETEKLDKLDIPYVVVDYSNIDELKEAVKVMGSVFGEKEKAESYVKFFDKTINMATEKIKNSNKEKPLVYHSVNEAIRTDTAGDICGEITNLAGVRNASVENGLNGQGEKSYTTLEEIYNWDPQVILANESSVTEYIITDSKWSGLKAVKDKDVYTLPVGATRWCHPGSMEAHMAVLYIAQKFYPEEFSDLDMEQYTKDYYETYFGLKLDDKTVKKILSGQGMRRSNEPVK